MNFILTQTTDSESSRANSVSEGGKGDSNGNEEEEEREDVEEEQVLTREMDFSDPPFVGSDGNELPLDPKLQD